MDIVNSLETLRKEYIRQGYDAQGLATVTKKWSHGETRYEVRHEGVLLGWTTKVANAWHTYLVTGVGTGRLVDTADTRRDGVNEIVWLAGRYENAVKIAERHTKLEDLDVEA